MLRHYLNIYLMCELYCHLLFVYIKKLQYLTRTDRNVYKLVAFQYPMRVMLFLRVTNTGICSIFVQVTVVNVPPVAHGAV